jgi:hypothetical protein
MSPSIQQSQKDKSNKKECWQHVPMFKSMVWCIINNAERETPTPKSDAKQHEESICLGRTFETKPKKTFHLITINKCLWPKPPTLPHLDERTQRHESRGH